MYFSKMNGTMIFIIFISIAMLAAGIFLIVDSARKKKKQSLAFGIVFVSIVIGLLTLGFVLATGTVDSCMATCEANNISARDIFVVLFPVIGICGLILVFVFSRRSSKKYSTPVQATCIDENGPVYQITLNGEQHTLEREFNPRHGRFGFYHVREGEVRTLYIDENDLGNYYDPSWDKSIKTSMWIFLSVVSVVFIAIGALIFFVSR